MHATSQENLTDDQIAENKTKFAALFSDQAKMAEAMAKGSQMFKDADKDGDGFLNKDEFIAYGRAGEAHAKEMGWHIPENTDE